MILSRYVLKFVSKNTQIRQIRAFNKIVVPRILVFSTSRNLTIVNDIAEQTRRRFSRGCISQKKIERANNISRMIVKSE